LKNIKEHKEKEKDRNDTTATPIERSGAENSSMNIPAIIRRIASPQGINKQKAIVAKIPQIVRVIPKLIKVIVLLH
jgi:hypothetical protein